MAWSRSNLTATERALIAADKPVIIAPSNALLAEGSPGFMWTSGPNYDFTDTSITDPTAPTKYVSDGYHHRQSASAALLSSSRIMLLLRLNTSGTSFDSVFVMGHNLGSVCPGSGVTVTAEISDTSGFASATALCTATVLPGINKRIVCLNLNNGANPLGTPGRYSGVAYLRIDIQSVDAMETFAVQPRIAEVVLGARYQFTHQPDDPYDDKHLRSDVRRFRGSTGVITTYVRSKGQRILVGNFREQQDLGEFDALENAWVSGADYGTKPVFWLPNPGTRPDWAPFGVLEPEQTAPTVEVLLRERTLAFEETAPFWETE